MNGAPKRIRSCPAHPGRDARYRPQPLAHSAPFATSPFSSPRKPHTHRFSLTRNADIPRPHAASLSNTPLRSASSPQRHQGHDTTTLPYAKDANLTRLRVWSTAGRPDQRNAPPRQPRTTYESPTSGTSHPQTGPKRPSHRQHNTAHTACPRQIPTSYYHATMQRPACKPYNSPRLHTHTLHPRDPTPLTGPRQQATHSQSVPAPDPCPQGGPRGNRGWPGHRRPKTTTPKTTPPRPRTPTPKSV